MRFSKLLSQHLKDRAMKPKSRILFSALLAGTALASVYGYAQDAQTSKLDPQAQQVLNQLAALDPKPITQLSPAEARRQPSPADAVKALLDQQGKSTAPQPVGNVDNIRIPGPAGQIPARIYTPQGSGPFPVLVYYHGGGWVIADLDTYDASARALASASNSVVVSVHYRQAPEHKFPAAPDDAYAAYQWAVTDAARFNGDPRNVAVAGESAGGNLAAVVSRRARDAGIQLPTHQLLIYPVTNYAFDTESYREQANAKPLNADMMRWFWGHYLNNPADGANPDASPLRAQNLRGLPPATVITAEIDPLRSEGKAYADRLREAGVPVEYKNYPGMPHEFFGMSAVLDKAQDAVQLAAVNLPINVAQRGTDVRGAEAPARDNAATQEEKTQDDREDLPRAEQL